MDLPFRYRRLGYAALNVTRLEASRRFYCDLLGLADAGTSAAGEAFFRCSPRHHDLMLVEAPVAGLKRVGWQMETKADLDAIRAHCEGALGLTTHEVPAAECTRLGLRSAFRITEPNTGACFEYYCEMADAATPYVPTVTKIARLGHVVLQTATHAATERYFLDALNFRASDRIEGAVTFLRCFPNPLHHSFGLSHSTRCGLHHVNFMVTDIDDIGRALYRMQAAKVPIVFGPGRHPPSESIFLYFLDPDGLTVEYSFGMEEFPEHAPREPRLLPMKLESIDYWGGRPGAGFGANGVLEHSEA